MPLFPASISSLTLHCVVLPFSVLSLSSYIPVFFILHFPLQQFFPQFFLTSLSSYTVPASCQQISLHFGNRRAVSRSVTLQHTVSNHDNAGHALIESEALLLKGPEEFKNLHRSNLWITVPLLLTGVCSSC